MPNAKDDGVYERWIARVTDAKRYHEDEFLEWSSRVEDYWRRRQWTGTATANYEHVVVNKIYSATQTIVPRLLFKNPEPIVTPLVDRIDVPGGQAVDVVKNARTMKAVLGQKMRVMGFKPQMKRTIRNAYLHMGWAKMGWGHQYGGPMRARSRKLKPEEGKEPLQETPVTGSSTDIHADQPWMLNVHPRDIWLPSWARGHDDIDFIVHRCLRRVEDVKRDPRYKNTEDLQGSRGLRSMDKGHDRHERRGEEAESFVELWEIHYRDADEEGNVVYQVLTLAEGHREILAHEEDIVSNVLGHYCIVPLIFAEDPDRIYPRGDCYQALPQQDEINRLRSHGLEVVKRQPTTYIASKPAFDEKEMEKLQSAEPQKIVFTAAADVNAAITHIQAAPLSADFYNYQGLMDRDFQEVTGVGANQSGAVSGAGSATETAIIQQNIDIRTAEKIDIVKDFVVARMEDIANLLTHFATTEEMVRVAGPDGMTFVTWNRDSIRGRYEYSIDLTSMMAPNDPVRKKLSLDLYNLGSMQPHVFNQTELARGLLKNFADVYPDPGKLLREGQEPSQAEELLALTNGQPARTQPWFNHAEHMNVLDQWAQTPAFAALAPELQQIILVHRNEHEQYMMMATGGVRKGGSPMEAGGANPRGLSDRTPTLGSLRAGAAGGRRVGAF